jgi:pterin-4a-carbinolamine dehydratase
MLAYGSCSAYGLLYPTAVQDGCCQRGSIRSNIEPPVVVCGESTGTRDEGMARRVFLSYRRSDSAIQATILKFVLQQKLPDVLVFVDAESVNPSQRWPDRLRKALANSSAVVALIGPNWRFGPDGTDRFANPKDWVLQELAYALKHKVDAIVPVFLDTTASMTAYRDLPPSLIDMPEVQGLELEWGEHWWQEVDRLASLVAKILGTVAIGGTIQFPNPSELKKRAPRLTEAEFDEHKLAVPSLAGWVFSHVPINTSKGEVEGTQISRSFTFTNFKRAFIFMARSAELAESRSHHPDWTNVWNHVDVRLRTFDAEQSVTWYDIEMACNMHELAEQVANEDKIGWPLRSSLRRQVQTKPR